MKNTQLMEYTVPAGMKATKTALVLPSGMKPEEWAACGEYLQAAQKSLGVWKADWLSYGRANFETEFVEKTLVQMTFDLKERERLNLLGEVQPAHRHEALTSEHYLIAAKRLDNDKERETWLFTAQSEGLTPRELQASIRAHEVIRIEMEKRQVSLPSPYAARAEYRAWRKELGEAWQEWNRQDFLDVAETMKEMAECYSWLLNMAEKAPPR
jgi:hypothetical protein